MWRSSTMVIGSISSNRYCLLVKFFLHTLHKPHASSLGERQLAQRQRPCTVRDTHLSTSSSRPSTNPTNDDWQRAELVECSVSTRRQVKSTSDDTKLENTHAEQCKSRKPGRHTSTSWELLCTKEEHWKLKRKQRPDCIMIDSQCFAAETAEERKAQGPLLLSTISHLYYITQLLDKNQTLNTQKNKLVCYRLPPCLAFH